MLEKDKNCIEFSMRSMMATHKPYQEDTEIAITGMAPGKNLLLANNPFDIPCDVVVVSKSYFEALQTENEQLKKKLHEYDPMLESKDLLKQLYSIDDVEELEWVLKHTCGGMCSANGWRAVSSFWRQKYKTLSKLVGFSSVEEIEDYLTNNVECDTLHEAVSKLRDEVTYTCEKLASANSENNSWKATAECNSPKELMTKLNLLRDTIKEWQKATGCKIPEAAKDLIESGASWHHAYNQVKEKNRKLTDDVDAWKNVTGYSTPEGCLSAILNNNIAIMDYKEIIQKWKDMTKCETPEAAATWITSYESACKRGNNLAIKIEAWKEVTGCSTPEDAKDWVDKLGEANGSLAKELLSWQNVTGCSTPKDLSKKIVEWETIFTPHMSSRDLCSAMSNAIESYKHKFAPWEEITGFSTPEKCSSYIDTLEKKLEDIKDLIEED